MPEPRRVETSAGPWRRVVGWLLLLLFAGWCVWFVRQHTGAFARVLHLRAGPLLLLAGTAVAGFVVNGLMLRSVLAAYDRVIALQESFAVSVVTALGNLIMPFSGGLGARALYLKKVHDLSLARFTGSLAGIYLLNLGLIAAVAAGVLVSLRLSGETLDPYLIAFTLLLGVGAFGAVLFGGRLSGRLPGPLAAVATSWETIRRDRARLVGLSVMLAVNIALSAVGLRCAFAAFDVTVGFGPVLYLTVLAALGTMLALTPGALGVAEAFQLIGSAFFGLPPEDVLLAALVVRVVHLPVILALGAPYSVLLVRRLSGSAAGSAERDS